MRYIELFPAAIKALDDVMCVNESKYGFGRADDGRTPEQVWGSFERHLAAYKSGELINEEDGGVQHIHQAMMRLIEFVDMQ